MEPVLEAQKEDIDSEQPIIKDDAYYKGLIEALLFIETEAIDVKKISEVLNSEHGQVRQWIHQLKGEYENRRSGLQIMELATGIRISTHPLYGDILKNYYKNKYKQKFSKSSLETLAIIAYKQPITRTEIEDIRGVSCDNAIHDLIEKKLIKIVGRKKVPGNPMEYGTTKDFLEFLGLKSVNDLPTLKEIKELQFD